MRVYTFSHDAFYDRIVMDIHLTTKAWLEDVVHEELLNGLLPLIGFESSVPAMALHEDTRIRQRRR